MEMEVKLRMMILAGARTHGLTVAQGNSLLACSVVFRT